LREEGTRKERKTKIIERKGRIRSGKLGSMKEEGTRKERKTRIFERGKDEEASEN
jgi:hypothetical protein